MLLNTSKVYNPQPNDVLKRKLITHERSTLDHKKYNTSPLRDKDENHSNSSTIKDTSLLDQINMRPSKISIFKNIGSTKNSTAKIKLKPLLPPKKDMVFNSNNTQQMPPKPPKKDLSEVETLQSTIIQLKRQLVSLLKRLNSIAK